ncbi:Arc family DNA-binding protein [Brucella pseudintermedia]|uniref:Arc family DNA-binding protein n=1 Tax=Brucella pseudintermedia TaxID=370111 RepID=UPI003671026A|nr:Arc family DNA-binding protein [Brucella pseudintermedia]
MASRHHSVIRSRTGGLPETMETKFVIRFPEGLRDFIKEEAAKSERSMNAEIIFQLKRAYGANEKSEAPA